MSIVLFYELILAQPVRSQPVPKGPPRVRRICSTLNNTSHLVTTSSQGIIPVSDVAKASDRNRCATRIGDLF